MTTKPSVKPKNKMLKAFEAWSNHFYVPHGINIVSKQCAWDAWQTAINAAPPPKPLVPLTDEQLHNIASACIDKHPAQLAWMWPAAREFARRVQAAHAQSIAPDGRLRETVTALRDAIQYAHMHCTVVSQLLMDANKNHPATWLGCYDDALNHSDYVIKRLSAALSQHQQPDNKGELG